MTTTKNTTKNTILVPHDGFTEWSVCPDCRFRLIDGSTTCPQCGCPDTAWLERPEGVQTSPLTTDYHGERVRFTLGQLVSWVDCDDGSTWDASVQEVKDGLLLLLFEDGQEGWEKPETCFHA